MPDSLNTWFASNLAWAVFWTAMTYALAHVFGKSFAGWWDRISFGIVVLIASYVALLKLGSLFPHPPEAPDFSASLIRAHAMPYAGSPADSLVLLIVDISNTGLTSDADQWSLTVRDNGNQVVRGELMPPTNSKPIIVNSPKGAPLACYVASDDLQNRASFGRMSSGPGTLRFLMRGIPSSKLESGSLKLEFSFKDPTGREYTKSFPWPLSFTPGHVAGLRDCATSPK